ncbi:MAG: hypothetical protein CL920_10230 [Deltaproteobacteria bacterium]|nr:hypothetical protein [Deltaproteobacteria bacterium]
MEYVQLRTLSYGWLQDHMEEDAMASFYKETGQKAKTERNSIDLTQRGFGKVIGVSASQLARVETGQVGVSTDSYQKILDNLPTITSHYRTALLVLMKTYNSLKGKDTAFSVSMQDVPRTIPEKIKLAREMFREDKDEAAQALFIDILDSDDFCIPQEAYEMYTQAEENTWFPELLFVGSLLLSSYGDDRTALEGYICITNWPDLEEVDADLYDLAMTNVASCRNYLFEPKRALFVVREILADEAIGLSENNRLFALYQWGIAVAMMMEDPRFRQRLTASDVRDAIHHLNEVIEKSSSTKPLWTTVALSTKAVIRAYQSTDTKHQKRDDTYGKSDQMPAFLLRKANKLLAHQERGMAQENHKFLVDIDEIRVDIAELEQLCRELQGLKKQTQVKSNPELSDKMEEFEMELKTTKERVLAIRERNTSLDSKTGRKFSDVSRSCSRLLGMLQKMGASVGALCAVLFFLNGGFVKQQPPTSTTCYKSASKALSIQGHSKNCGEPA